MSVTPGTVDTGSNRLGEVEPIERHATNANFLEYKIHMYTNPDGKEQHRQKLINDMHKTSVAHSIKNANCGKFNWCKPFDVVKKLMTGRNGLAPRVCRFFNEPGYYVDNDAIDKYILAVNLILMIIVIVSLCVMYFYEMDNKYSLRSASTYKQKMAKITELVNAYEHKDDAAKRDAYTVELLKLMDVRKTDDISKALAVDDMNSVFNSNAYNVSKFIMSSSIVILLVWNVFKRTTAMCETPRVDFSSDASINELTHSPLVNMRRGSVGAP